MAGGKKRKSSHRLGFQLSAGELGSNPTMERWVRNSLSLEEEFVTSGAVI